MYTFTCDNVKSTGQFHGQPTATAALKLNIAETSVSPNIKGELKLDLWGQAAIDAYVVGNDYTVTVVAV